jgi:dTDP-4-dehydrorhamnose reductase
MASAKSAVVIIGIAGNLGSELLRLLPDFSMMGVDPSPPPPDFPV